MTSIENTIVDRLQEFTAALKSREVISNEFTCRKIELILEPTPYDPQLVKQTRQVLGASQAIFAQFLGVSNSTVRAWELGKNQPNNMACRFMDEIRHDPKHWRGRIKSLVKQKKVADPY